MQNVTNILAVSSYAPTQSAGVSAGSLAQTHTLHIQSGASYTFVSVKTGTVMDLSKANNESVTGYVSNDGDNQKWIVTQSGTHWTIRCARGGRYLGWTGDAAQGVKLKGVDQPVNWDIRVDAKDPTAYRIYNVGGKTQFTVDLTSSNPASGTPIILYGDWKGPNQAWKLKLVTAPAVVTPTHAATVPTTIQSGKCYTFSNVKTGTVMDLSEKDHDSISGNVSQGADNQKWFVTQNGTHWTIRCARGGKYLGFTGDAAQGAKLKGVDHPVNWDIRFDEKDHTHYRIYSVGGKTPLTVDLTASNPANGTPIILYGDWKGPNQAWRLHLVAASAASSTHTSKTVEQTTTTHTTTTATTIQSGKCYTFANAKTGKVMDLSETDHESILGYTSHGGDNQKWFVTQSGIHWTIRCARGGRYLGFTGDAVQELKLKGVDHPVNWDIRIDEKDHTSFTIYTVGSKTPFAFDLSVSSAAHGSPIVLYGDVKGSTHAWNLKLVATPVVGGGGTPPKAASVTHMTATTQIGTTTTAIQSGKCYTFTNVKTGTVMDLSGTDHVSVSGYASHGTDNQKWFITQNGTHWTIRCACGGRYLGFTGDAAQGVKLKGVDHPVNWDIRLDEKDHTSYRIYSVGGKTPFTVDLTASNPASGTPIILYGDWKGPNQAWKLQLVAAPTSTATPHSSTATATSHSSTAISHSSTAAPHSSTATPHPSTATATSHSSAATPHLSTTTPHSSTAAPHSSVTQTTAAAATVKTHCLQPGRYYTLTNVKTGTVMDLSGTDGESILGYAPHGGDNQKWLITPNGKHWSICCMRNKRYLGFVGSATQGLKLKGVERPMNWDIRHDEKDQTIYRIYPENTPTPFAVDLTGSNSANRTPIILWKDVKGANQAWKFQLVPFIAPQVVVNKANLRSGGRYILSNVKTGTVLDLSGTDYHSIIGYTSHGGNNQQWDVTQRGNHWTLRCVRTGTYLGYIGEAKGGLQLQAVKEPFDWDIRVDEKDNKVHRIYTPGGKPPMTVDLKGSNPVNETPIILWQDVKGLNQAWSFRAV